MRAENLKKNDMEKVLNALSRGAKRVRDTSWPDKTYLKFHYTGGGSYGPWVTLYDAVFDSETKVLAPDIYDMLVEEYTGPLHRLDV